MTLSQIKKAFTLFLAIGLLQFYVVNLVKAQQPVINYSQSNFNFTKGIAITSIPSPNNSGGAIPNKIRGGVEESIGIGEFHANKISKSGNNNLVSILISESKVQKVDLTSKSITATIPKRDRPWSVVKDSKGNVYWTEPGTVKIVKNPSKPDETSFLAGALSFLAEADIPGVSDAVGLFNGVNEIYGHFSGGDDLLRKITRQEEDDDFKYSLKFSGAIYKLAPNSNTPEVFVTGIQVPTGITIDKHDNFYVSCFTANYEVKGGYAFSFGEVEKQEGESGVYDAVVIKISPDGKTITDLGAWEGIDYPSQIGIDDEENITLMYNSGPNMSEVSIARINKYAPGKTDGDTYKTAKFLLRGGTKLEQNLPMFLDMAVDGPGNLYLGDFYKDRVLMLPKNGSSSNDLQVFSENVLSPNALYVDLSTNQLWVKEGKYTSTGAIKKLSLYGYSVSPSLPIGLSITNTGTIVGTASNVSPNTTYTLIASNDKGFSKANFNLEVKQIAAPNISYASNTQSLPISQNVNIAAPNNAGGSFNQQIGPQTITTIYKGGTKIKGLAFDANGNKYFVQPDSNRIMKIDAAGKSSVYLSNVNKPSDIAIDRKTGTFYFSQMNGDDVSLKSVLPGFNNPTDITKGSVSGIAIDSEGDLYVCLQGNGEIYKFSTKTAQYVSVISGLNQPLSIAVTGNHLYIIDLYGNLERRLLNNLNSKTSLGKVNNAFEIETDDYGNLFIASNEYIYKVAAGSNTIAQLYPTFYHFSGLGVDRDNNLHGVEAVYGSSEFNVKKYVTGGYTISPSLPAGLTFNANGTITGTPTAITAIKDYVVTAVNPLGSSNATLKIEVKNVPTTNLQYTVPSVLFKGTTIAAIPPTITGGIPDSFSIDVALPAGLNLNTTTGVISGTPTANKAETTYTITANNGGSKVTTNFNLAVTEVPPASLNYTIASNILQRDITVNLKPTTTGGTAGVTYAISPSLPTGLDLNTSSGIISGIPTAITENKLYTITISNNGGSKQTSFNLSVKLDPPSDLTYVIAANLQKDVAITSIIPTYNGAGVSSFSIEPALPEGLSFNGITGVISGKPTEVRSNTAYKVTATNAGGITTATFQFLVKVDAPTSLKYDFAHTNLLNHNAIPTVTPTYIGSPAVSFEVEPSLPTGLMLNTSTGAISGTPTAITALKNYTVTAKNLGGQGIATFSLSVTELAPTALQYAFGNSSLLRDLSIAAVRPSYSGGTATSFSISPALPAGLSINTTTGIISGTPTAISPNTNYTVTASNSAGSTMKSFSLLVKIDPPTNLRYNFRDTELQKDIVITEAIPKYSGSPAAAFSIDKTLPMGLIFDTSSGKISGTPTALASPTNYTVTATNDAGFVTTSFTLSVARIPIPDISYANSVYKFTKGTPITIPAPENNGVQFAQQRIGEALYNGLTQPTGVATDASGNTYIGDFEGGNAKIKKIEKDGTEITEFISSGLGTIAPYDLAVDVAGNIYMSAGSVIKKITPLKVVTDFAIGLNNVTGLFIDSENDLYAAEYIAGQVLKFDDCNASAKSVVINGLAIGATTSTPAENPRDIVVDSQKNIYVLQASSLSDRPTTFMFLFKYFVSDGYTKNTRYRVITSVDYSSYMIMDKKNNLYINTDGNSAIILNNYIDKGGRVFSKSTGKMKGLSLDADQNVFYALSQTNVLGKNSQFGYNTAGLPDGLVLNANGTITGTPTTTKTQTNYGVTANSFYGATTANLQITVVDPVPQFNYAEANQILTAGVDALNIDLVKTGGSVGSYTISPTTLPAGISFNTTTGKLSGTPTVINDNVLTYTISATNTGGTGTTTVTFKIIDKAPNTLVYASSYVLYLNKQFSGQVPTVAGGPVTKWSISPALPQGLFIDVKTGVINGYGMTTSAAKNYTVTAENSGGSTTATINIEVKDLPPNISYALRSSFKFKKDITITPINAPSNDGGPIASYSTLSSLPAGLNLNTATGEITGKPTQLKSPTEYKIVANGGQWGKDTATVSLEIISLLPNTISYGDPITIVKGTAITKIKPTYTTSNGDPVERFSITPELPQGLTFNAANGEINGTPAEIFGSNGQLFYVKAENGAGSNTTMLVLLLKDLAPAITYNNTNVFTKGTGVELNVNATGGTVEKYVISPALPDGLSLDSISGKISGVPTSLNIKTQYTVTGTNYGNPASISSFYITVIDKTPQISYVVPEVFDRTVTIGDITVSSTGGAVVTYAISPALPTGLSLNTTTGTISGTPTVSTAAKNYVITATNTGGNHSATINFAVKNAKPIIAYGTAYEFNKSIAIADITPTSTGGNQITYSITPSLPNGLSLNTETGVISGTATVTKPLATYTIKAVNDGGEHTDTFTITVNEKPPGQISYAEITTDFYVGYTISPLSPNVENGGGEIANYTIAPANLAPGLIFNTSTGVISGKPTSDFIRTTYIITAHNSGGTSQTTVTFAVIKLSATVSKTDVKCFGSATGTATVTVVGGKAPFNYTWSANSGNTETATALKAGNYTVTIKDANNSTITANVTINEPTLLEITNITKVDNQQNAGTNGTATATVIGGTAPYTYVWSSNSSTTATASNLAEGTYTLTVTDANNCSASKTVVIDAPPVAPSTLVAQAGNAKNVLNWQANTETDLASYKVYGGITSNPTNLLQVITAPITTYTHENLINGTNYYYRITAVDKAGYESIHSSQANATPQGSQSITFAASQAKTYGDADFNPGATASSGLAVSYTTDNPLVATIVAGKVHIVGAGTVNITASQAGNGTWLAATSQSQELTVNKRSLTVTATGNNKVYDGNLTSTVNLRDNRVAGDQLSASYSFAIFDDKNVGTSKNIAVFGITIAGANAGNYSVNATTNATASITAKLLTITADDKTNIQGLPLPAFTASYNGFVSGEDSNILTAKPSLSTSAISSSPQGPYSIVAAGATAQNYSITHANGILTVQPGTPTNIALAQQLLLENQPSGTAAGTLSSIAPDPNATFTYTLVAGVGSTDNDKFSIQGNTIRTLAAFDYESQQVFNVRIRTTTQYGASLEQAFTINLTDVNEIPTIADVNNQTICFTSSQQSVPLTGITAGPETNQTTTLSVSSSNNNLFSSLSVGNVSNGNATLNYRVANGQSGTATITVTVTDNGGTANNGVNTISKSFVIIVNPLPQIAIASELGTSFAKGKTTKLTATGGVSYQWSGSAGIIGSRNASTLEVRPESASGTYTVLVTSAEGCTSTQSITLTTTEDIGQISGTNIITPNGDGVNDNLIIKNVDLYPNNELEIFDRAGRRIYSKKGYQNEWNGSFNGIPLAEGTYYYIINFIGVGKYKGFITIIKD